MRPTEAIAKCGAKGKSERGWRRLRRRSLLALAASLVGMATGCNSSTSSAGNSNSAASSPDLYLAAGAGNLETYAIDHTANTFVTSTYNPSGATVQDSGRLSVLSNGVVNLDITYFPGQEITNAPLTGNWALELPGEAALVELETTNQYGTTTSFAPLVPTQSCPSLTTAETFQFVTIPKRLNASSTPTANGWNPQIETAYGSVSIATNGTAVKFSSVSQYTLPSANGGVAGAPSNPAPSSATAVCSPTFFGQTISVPSSVTVTNPNPNGSGSVPASATIGIGPSGFLLEDAGSGAADPTTNLTYENILGAGYGAIGLPKPTSPLTTSTMAAARYQGILYGAASGSSANLSATGFRLIGSFGYSNLQTSCPTLPAPSTGTILYGGEFANNDPSSNTFGNCDLAIDLGTQDSKNNGLYPAATVYVTASFPNNGIGRAYSFPAVAIAGEIDGKYAIFLIGMDNSGLPPQPWGIYLLQSS